MKDRCHRLQATDFKNYGGRGIEVCAEWIDFVSFQKWAMAHGYQDGLTIERIDNNGNYEPRNCRWATRKEQGNNKRNNRSLSFAGQTMSIGEWAKRIGVNYKTLYTRFYQGWSVEKLLTTPTRKSARW